MNEESGWKAKLACVWGGELVSVLTSSVLQMGFVWHITLTTNSASMLSLASLAGFLPLLSGAPTAEMAEKLVRNLKNPATFGTPFPVPSISFSQPEFYSKDMWRGPVWININTLIARGLDRYGYRDEARQLRGRTMRELEKFYCRYGTFFEFYDDRNECDPPELLRKFRCDPDRSVHHQAFMDYGWSATLYIDLAFTMYN